MKSKVLLAFNNLMDFTMTEVSLCLCEWVKYYATHPDIELTVYRANKWGFERNFNEFIRYAVEGGFDYFFQYDADMTGDPRIIERLMLHDKEAVGCLYFSRTGSHAPQLWNVDYTQGKRYYCQFNPETVAYWVKNSILVPSDVRASGFTLFKTDIVKAFGYPYGEHRKNDLDPYAIDGFDMDLTYKISRKYGAVWTDCSLENQVRHWTFAPVTAVHYTSSFTLSQPHPSGKGRGEIPAPAPDSGEKPA